MFFGILEIGWILLEMVIYLRILNDFIGFE